MARATLATVKQIIYENLGISPDTYGTLATNKRYKSGYIDDAIVMADLATTHVLLKNKQDALLEEILSNSAFGISPGDLATTLFEIAYVEITENGVAKRGIEIPYGTFEEWETNGGTVYDATYMNYHFSVQDNNVYFFGDSATVYYVTLLHAVPLVTLYSPQGFESALANLASAILLEKRNDNPEQAKVYREYYQDFMETYMIPNLNQQHKVDAK